MRFFYNTKNKNKYATENQDLSRVFLKCGYKEITREEFKSLPDIF